MDKVLIWCNLNVEQDLIAKMLGDKCISIQGSTPPNEKIRLEKLWREGDIPVLITKPLCFGFGMNWQCCSKMIFIGLSDSFEQMYQAIRRCWRFGQKHRVKVYIIVSETEGAVVANIKRKEADFERMLSEMIKATSEISKANIRATRRDVAEYNPQIEMIIPNWLKEDVS
jgi:SNF2 family DNA or RNA helicase